MERSEPASTPAGASPIVVVLIFALIPVVWLISLSLKPPDDDHRPALHPADISFDNYKSLFEGGIDEAPSSSR